MKRWYRKAFIFCTRCEWPYNPIPDIFVLTFTGPVARWTTVALCLVSITYIECLASGIVLRLGTNTGDPFFKIPKIDEQLFCSEPNPLKICNNIFESRLLGGWKWFWENLYTGIQSTKECIWEGLFVHIQFFWIQGVWNFWIGSPGDIWEKWLSTNCSRTVSWCRPKGTCMHDWSYWETKASVHPKPWLCCTLDYFFSFGSSQIPYSGIPLSRCGCWVWKPNVCLFGTGLWGKSSRMEEMGQGLKVCISIGSW